jgi:hypothetical protein
VRGRKRFYGQIWWRDLPAWSRLAICLFILGFVIVLNFQLEGRVLAVTVIITAVSMLAAVASLFLIRLGFIERGREDG